MPEVSRPGFDLWAIIVSKDTELTGQLDQEKRSKFYDQPTRDKIDDEFKRIDDIQAGSNNSKKPIKKKPVKKKPSKKKNPLTTKQRSRNAKNYWRTKKKLQNRMTEETRKKYGLSPKG